MRKKDDVFGLFFVEKGYQLAWWEKALIGLLILAIFAILVLLGVTPT